MTLDLRRGDVVLVAFPFIVSGQVHRKLRPALVVQADRYNRKRDEVILAAITSAKGYRSLPCKWLVTKVSPEGRAAGLRIDSVVDGQTLVTIPRGEIVRRLGRFPPASLGRIGQALQDALGLVGGGGR